MATNAELAAKLLREASTFFRTVGDQNEHLKDQLHENAQVYDQVAELVESNPTGMLEPE